MIPAKALALYKNRPVLVLEAREKLDIKLEDGSLLKVREKDLVLLHGGPVAALPSPAEGGDFETARQMYAPADGAEAALLPWGEAAELVFGASGPAEVLACWKAGQEGLLFKGSEAGLLPLSDAELERERSKRAKKEGEAAERAAFLERARRAASRKLPPAKAADSAVSPEVPAASATMSAESAFLPGDERFLGEIEALALGKSSKSKLMAELGLAEEAAAAHAFLLRSGRWDSRVNPHPSRAGCVLHPPRIVLDEEEAGPPRRDLRHLAAWAIDNAWSHDPDDAVSWDGEAVWVHVADPAAAIRPDSPAEKEALSRGNTLYLPESTTPLLPDEALERYGLGLKAESPALSFRILLGEDASVAEVEVLPTLLKVRRSHYAEADGFLAGEAPPPELVALAEIAGRRQARREANGAIDIDIPEVALHLREGRILIEPLPSTRSSGIVRELMLLAGEAAARWAFDRGLAFPYYGQEAPGEAGKLPPGLPGEFAKRKLMRAGISGPTPTAHRGLGLPFYAQATSPLRRYQDLLGHMQIRAVLGGREPLDADEVQRRSAQAQAAQAATRQAERASDLHWTLAWLLEHPDWEGEGIIVGNAGPGAWQVYLPALGHETRLKLGPNRELGETLRLHPARVDLAKLESAFDERR